MRRVPGELRDRFFVEEDHTFRLRDRLKRRVQLQRINLIEDPLPASPSWDLVLCRNLFIYYQQEHIQHVATKLSEVLSDEGWLFLGAAENLRGCDVPLYPVEVAPGCIAYRRKPTPRVARNLNNAWNNTPKPSPPTPIAPLSSVALPDPATVFPTSPPAHALNRGHEALAQHDFDDALNHYRQALDNDTLNPALHFYIGVVHRKRGALDDAESALRNALFLNPDYWPAAFLLAGVYERLGRVERARRAFQNVLRVLESQSHATQHVASPFHPPASEVEGICRAWLQR